MVATGFPQREITKVPGIRATVFHGTLIVMEGEREGDMCILGREQNAILGRVL